MADSLRSLAGAAFRVDDVISRLHAPIKAEDLVLDRYVFLPHARSGIAAALTQRFEWSGRAQGTVEVKVPVIDERGALDAQMTVHVHGPADVTEIDARQIIRTLPKADAATAEIDDLVHVEFDRPDMPWLFTPTGPDGAGRLIPWITLVVTERRHIELGEKRGATRAARIRRDQLQPLGDAWAWAHAQVMGAKTNVDSPPTLDQRLSVSNAAHNLSRLVCPRRLSAQTHYVACVVPTFLAGAQAGLGLTPIETLAPAWGTADNFASGDARDMVRLPVYYAWSFTTGEAGNFESLARKLLPAVAPPGVGRRRVDATRPWEQVALDPGDPGAEIVVAGPVVSPQQPESAPEEQWPPEAAQRWEPTLTRTLVGKLNGPDVQAHTENPGPPIVGPPLYGSNHARQPRVETEPPASDEQPPWFRELNTDPRDRIVGGLGTRVVQADQEDLMAAAWNQVIGVEAANRALRLAQLAKHVSASLHARHLARMTDSAVIASTERVHAKLSEAPQRTVWAALEDSSLPTSVTVGAFRRLTRVRGPVARTSETVRAQRALAVDGLTVRSDRLTTDWVRVYGGPDGVRAIGALARPRLTAEIAERLQPGADPERLLAAWDAELALPAPPDHLTRETLAGVQFPPSVELHASIARALVQRIVRAMPTEREVAADPEVAITGAGHAIMLNAIFGVTDTALLEALEVSAADAERLGLGGRNDDGAGVRVDPEEVRSIAGRALQAVVDHGGEAPFGEFRPAAERVQEFIGRNERASGRLVLEGLKALAAKVVADDPFSDRARSRRIAPEFGLVTQLNPVTTVPGRIKARLTTGSGRMPAWLAPQWFDDGRIEPVMAHPRFRYPMYEPLNRYDREWMVAGLGLIQRPDMATVLETNNRFIEAYLVGLNHEMGRELLWREYPTDQRGTYFDSFWTGKAELVADLHKPPWGAGELGSHVAAGLGKRLVFLVRGDLVRRYPGVVAHAVRQATGDDGEGLEERGIPRFETGTAQSPVRTLFSVHLAPNVLLVGFDLTLAQVSAEDVTWWFTLSENPSEPRFGLDPSRDPADELERDSLVWGDFEVAPGGFLDATRHTHLGFVAPRDPPLPPPVTRSQWGASSAQIAYLLFQLPARAAFLGRNMVAKATEGAP